MKALNSSFRDPSGFVFLQGNNIFRVVNNSYRDDYDKLMSKLYPALTQAELLISHTEVDFDSTKKANQYKLLQAEKIPFISYPYEWSFSQYKDAALTTLAIQRKALEQGMTLKDASIYNIQFYRGKPIFIDTLSFEKYEEGSPWIAYGQFCRHFLAPLTLMAYHDPRMGAMMRDYIDGIPLDLASGLLPFKSRFRVPLFLHIHLHASSQKRHADSENKSAKTAKKFSHAAMMGLIDSLENGIKKLRLKTDRTEWGAYYEETILSNDYLLKKQTLVSRFLEDIDAKLVWDVGANDGTFSRLAAKKSYTVAFDIDHLAVEYNYLKIKEKQEKNILPLLLDLTNPSPAIGWNNEERDSIFGRENPDLILALALVHHLAISNNVPLRKLATFFANLTPQLIVEFVPKIDLRVRTLLATREDIFPDYTKEGFEAAFNEYFTIEDMQKIEGTDRVLYLMQRK